MTSQTIPTIERNLIMTITNDPEDEPNRSRRIVDLCQESLPLWDPETKTYPTGSARAEAITGEMDQIRKTLAAEVKQRLTGSDSHLLRLATLPRLKFANGQWRSSIWIDLLYKTDVNGNTIEYDHLARSDRGAHLFRIWFTARGIGIGIRPSGRETHGTLAALIASLPTG